MELEPSPEVQSESYTQLITAARVFGLIALLIGILILSDWIFNITLLKSFLPAWPALNPNTALGYIAASVSLLLQCFNKPTRLQKNISFSLAFFILILGISTCVEYFLNVNLYTDMLISPLKTGFLLPNLNRTSPANAINFIFFGFCILLVDLKISEVIRPSQFFAILCGFLPLHSLIFQAYGVQATAEGLSYLLLTRMSQPAAVAWLCLSLGSLLMRPNKGLVLPFAFDQEISATWRSILLTGIIIPLIFGFIFSLGFRKGFYGPEFGFSVLALASVFMMAFLIWRSANHNWQVRKSQIDVENKIKTALQLRDEFLSIASHELKTPLTSLSLQAQISKLNLLRDDPHVLTKEQLLKFLTKMDFQVVRLAHLVEDMLDISRIDSGRFTPVLSQTDVGQLVYDVVDQLSPQLAAAGCNITTCIPESMTAFWDSYRIEQVLVNIITNAIKYGAKKPILIEVREKNKIAILSVKDCGIGIAKENQQRIFNRFERAVSAKGITGLGLGLYIVKQILDSHQGEITVDSEPDQGSTFIVKLPLSPISVTSPHKIKDASYGISS